VRARAKKDLIYDTYQRERERERQRARVCGGSERREIVHGLLKSCLTTCTRHTSCVYIYLYIYTDVCVCIYIYIIHKRKRARKREPERSEI